MAKGCSQQPSFVSRLEIRYSVPKEIGNEVGRGVNAQYTSSGGMCRYGTKELPENDGTENNWWKAVCHESVRRVTH